MRIKLKDGKELDLTEEVIQKVADLIIDSGDLKPDYPYVGVAYNTHSIVCFYGADSSQNLTIKSESKLNNGWLEDMFKPFTGSIHYVDGKPVKTVID